MSDELKPKHVMALWRMIFAEPSGELPLAATGLKGKEREPLTKAGLIEVVKSKNGSMRLVVTDSGWHWSQQHLDAPLNATARASAKGASVSQSAGKKSPIRVVSPVSVLQHVLGRLRAHLDEKSMTLADFASPNVTSDDEQKLEEQIRTAYFKFTGERTNEKMPVAALRSVLANVPRVALDGCLLAMMGKPGVALFREDDPEARSDVLNQGALNLGGELKHYLKLER